nr:MAG TPA: hypothetical protein [Caudoviricetes sp.]
MDLIEMNIRESSSLPCSVILKKCRQVIWSLPCLYRYNNITSFRIRH